MVAEKSSGFVDGASSPGTELRRQAQKMLLDIYQDLAPTEALMRALIGERDGDRPAARMWLDVYDALCDLEAKGTGSEIVRL